MNLDGRPEPWQTTFGDLLTLLMCFFVAMLAHRSSGTSLPAAKTPVEQQISSNSMKNSVSNGVSSTSGTIFAASQVGESSPDAEFVFGRVHLKDIGRMAVELPGSFVTRARIGSCGTDWDEVGRNARAVQQWAERSGIPPARMEIGLSGGCTRDSDEVARVAVWLGITGTPKDDGRGRRRS